MLIKSFIYFNFLILIYMMIVQFIVTLIIYPLHRLCLRKMRDKYLNAKIQKKVAKFDDSFSYFRFNQGSPMAALVEGILFFPEMIISAVIAVITLCVIEVLFHFFGLDTGVFLTANFEAIILLTLICAAVFLQLKMLNRRFIKHQLELSDNITKLEVSPKYLEQRMMYDSLFNILFFMVGFMLWIPFFVMGIAATYYQLYLTTYSTAICLVLVIVAIIVRRIKSS